jgi:hypothetical protein
MKIVVPVAAAGIAAALALSAAPAFAASKADIKAGCKAEFGGPAGRNAAERQGLTRKQMIQRCVQKAMHGAKHK